MMFTSQVDSSMQRFLTKFNISLTRSEDQLYLSGCDVIDNNVNKAIINQQVVIDNMERLADWATKVKLLSVYKQVAYVPLPMEANYTGNSSKRLDDYISFINDDTLLVGSISEEYRSILQDQLRRRFYQEITIVDLPEGYRHDDMEGNCGSYMGSVMTSNYLYMPVYGNDPANWEHGHSSMMDKVVTQIVQSNTARVVVPVNIPRVLCAIGENIRALSWSVEGPQAQVIVNAARWTARQRALRLVAH